MELLLEHGADMEAVTNTGRTALLLAIEGDHDNVVQFLVKQGASVNAADEDGTTALHHAATSGNIGTMQLLLKHGADLHAVTTDGTTAFHHAASRGRVKNLQLLLKHGADLHAVTKTGETALVFAAKNTRYDVVKFLLTEGVAVNAVDEDGKTAFHHAAEAGDVGVLRLLLKQGADKHAVSKVGETALHISVAWEHLEAVRFLLKQGCPVNAVDEDGDSAFIRAANSGYVSIMELLLEHGADMEAVTNTGRTALLLAIEGDHDNVVQFLVKQGASVNAADEDGTTALHHAATSGNIGTMQLLLKHGADLHAVTTTGRTALLFAMEGGHEDAVQFLVKEGAAVNAADEDGTTAFHHAATNGDISTMQLLLKHGADLHALTKTGGTALLRAIEGEHDDAVQFLLNQGAGVNVADEDGTAAIHHAATNGNIGTMQLLLMQGADIHAVTMSGRTGLLFAMEGDHEDAVQFLVKQGASVNAADEDGTTALHHAATSGNIGTMQLLLKHGADLHAVTTTGRTALLFAMEGGHEDAVQFLVKEGAAVNAADEDGTTAFHHAATNGDISTMQLLLKHGADVDAVTRTGQTALHVATEKGHYDVVRFLLKHGAVVDAKYEDGSSAIHDAARKQDIQTLRILVESGADLHGVGEDEWTVLHYSVKGGDVDVVKYLLELGLPANAQAADGETAFHFASGDGRTDIMRVLREYGGDINATTKAGETPLDYAAYNGHFEAIEFLLEAGASVHTIQTDGSTVLHSAAHGGDFDTLELLVEHGVDIQARDNDGKSALHICAHYDCTDFAGRLIELGVVVDAKEEDGWTALHFAASNGQVEMMQALIELGADVHELTATLSNVLHLAVESEHVDVLEYALPLGVDSHALAQVDDEWCPPLVLAFRKDDSEVAYNMVQTLCSHGATLGSEHRRAVLESIASAELTSDEEEEDDTSPESPSDEEEGDDTPSESPSDDEEDDDTSPEPALWRLGLCTCVDHWTQEYQAGTASLTSVPIEIVQRGEASVKTYLADALRSASEEGLLRCKICVVGPSEWGKTSLVQSLMANKTYLTKLKDRTVGIDLTTWLLKSIVKKSPVRSEITFWDFAGQDVYQAAHTLFFSRRTLFVLVVDLEAYWKELEGVQVKAGGSSEAQMFRFVRAKIFRWVRSILAHQPDAKFMVVGTKMNQLEDARVVDEIWDDLRDRLDHWKAASAKGLGHAHLPGRSKTKTSTDLQSRLSNLASSKWLASNLMDIDSISHVRNAIEKTVTSSELGFMMWKTYTQVLQSVVRRREVAKNAVTARERIEKSIIRFSNLRRQLLREIEELDRDACEQIMRTLNDLGDVLWYEHEGAGVFKDYIILDPMLVIEVVREVIRHDFPSQNEGHSPQDGRVTHALLSTFPLWKDMDMELMHAFKALLQHFQLAYPADADVMLPGSDIIVPAYWNANQSPGPRSKSLAPQKSICDAFPTHRWCWEYEIPSELSETIFVQFSVQSHSSYLPRTIRGFCVDATCAEFATSIALIQSDSPRDVLRIEVSGVSAELGWHNMRYYLMKMEKVLEGYRGDVIWRFIVHRQSGSKSESRHPVGSLMKAIEESVAMGKGAETVRTKMPWMPPQMDWFLRKSWNDVALIQQLQVNDLVEEKLDALRKLAIAGNAPRQFPALWSLEYIPEAQKAVLRISSDLSGRCYHVPIEIDTGSPLLARHASIFKAGVSLFATVVGNAVSLSMAQTVVETAISALNDKADGAVVVHNLIDKLDLSSQDFDARTNSRLSPGASMVLLRDLLKAYDDSVGTLEISEISNLECAVTSSGEYVWAHAHEIVVMGSKITRCSAPPSTWDAFESEDETAANVKDPATSPQAAPASSAVTKKTESNFFKFSISVNSVVGLSDWDWHKTYCKWQLYYSNKSLTPLAVDVTPTNGDSSQAPSWSSMRKSVEAVTSVEMLRECRLTVQVKRRSRIGWTKHIGEGQVWLRDFLDDDAAQNFSCEPVKVPLDQTMTDRAVIIHLAAEK